MLENMINFLGSRFVRYTAENMFEDPIVSILVSAGSRVWVGGLTLLEDSLVIYSRLKADHLLYIGIGGSRSPTSPIETFLTLAFSWFHWSPIIAHR